MNYVQLRQDRHLGTFWFMYLWAWGQFVVIQHLILVHVIMIPDSIAV